jgi:hypothetical protein
MHDTDHTGKPRIGQAEFRSLSSSGFQEHRNSRARGIPLVNSNQWPLNGSWRSLTLISARRGYDIVGLVEQGAERHRDR